MATIEIDLPKDEFYRILENKQRAIARNIGVFNAPPNEGDVLLVHCPEENGKTFACEVSDITLIGDTDFFLLISVCKVGLIPVR